MTGPRRDHPARRGGPATLASLLGAWTLTRRFDPTGARLLGVASFSAEGDDVAYHETGVLTLADGTALDCQRRFRLRALPSALEVRFDDGPQRGAIFVRLAFRAAGRTLLAADRHQCGADLYAVRVRAAPGAGFITDIEVRGPAKFYRAISRYQRPAG